VTAVLADRPVTCTAAMLRWSTSSLADTTQNPPGMDGYGRHPAVPHIGEVDVGGLGRGELPGAGCQV
jgi:hypothetical protein